MENEIPLFCTQCGATLKESAAFCQECGAPVSGTVAGGTQAYQNTTGKGNIRLFFVSGLLVMLAAFMLYLGVVVLMDINGLMTEFMSNPDNVQLMLDYGITEELLREALVYVGYMFIAIGVLALIDAALIFTRRFWGVALALTIVLTVITFVSVIGLFIGVMAIYFLYSAKDEFA